MLEERFKEVFNNKLESELEVTLQNTISDLEKLTPNAKAIERLREVETKLRNYDKEYNVARQKERQVNERFKKCKRNVMINLWMHLITFLVVLIQSIKS